MLGVNRVFLMGKTYNKKSIVSKNGKPITFFTLATYKKQGEGEKDKALFHDCVAYGKLAEILDKYLVDGKELYVDGVLDYYEKDGVKKSQIVVIESQFTSEKSA